MMTKDLLSRGHSNGQRNRTPKERSRKKMPFDYNSFMQGVQTGLRLGRTSPGRVPPMPPVPSGKYILTEGGIPVITEDLFTPTDVSLYQYGRWYPASRYASSDYDAPVIKTGIDFIIYSDTPRADAVYYFYSYFPDSADFLSLVLVSRNSLDNTGFEGRYREGESGQEEFAFSMGIIESYRAGDYYYHQSPGSAKWRPNGMTCFEGRSISELEAFIAGIEHRRMITEGG